MLQIVTSRLRRSKASKVDFGHVLTSFRRVILFLVMLLWLIVLTTNLNIYNSALNGLGVILSAPRSIGNASFTLGGILLFFMIIWIAHLLQKYVGYFLAIPVRMMRFRIKVSVRVCLLRD